MKWRGLIFLIRFPSFNNDVKSMMGQTVQCCIGHDGIREERNSVLREEITGNDERRFKVPFGYNSIEVFGLSGSEDIDPEVIEFISSTGRTRLSDQVVFIPPLQVA